MTDEEVRKELEEETELYPREIERILNIWERQEKGEFETIPEEEVWEQLGIDD